MTLARPQTRFHRPAGSDAIEPPGGATAFERALTLSGRDPNWKPAS